MTTITYAVGDATRPPDGPAVVCHVVNDAGRWGAGFVLAVGRRWPHVRDAYLREHAEGPMQLGTVQFVGAGDGVVVANMVAQRGTRSRSNPRPLCYDALEECLRSVAGYAAPCAATGVAPVPVHMPRIGCGLAGGTWSEVEPIIRRTLCAAGVPVTVYDLPSGGGA